MRYAYCTMTKIQEKQFNAIITLADHDFKKVLNLYAFYKLQNHEVGEELVQDTFTKTWNYLVKGGEIVLMKAFLFHILNDLIIDQYRKHKTVSLGALLEKGFEPSTNGIDQIFDVIDGKSLFLLINQLPKKYQKVINMRFVRLLSLTEIANITGQTKNSIAVQSSRGLEKLKILYNHK